MNGRLAKLRRVQELFTEGRIVVLGDGESSEPFWVMKPTAFERDEALKDARAARARRALRFDRDETEKSLVNEQLDQLDRDALINSLIGAKGNEHYVKALDAVRADKDWAERIEVIDRGGLEADRDANDGDRDTVQSIVADYLAHVSELQQGYADDLRSELNDLTDAELREQYRQTWREMTSFEAFMETRRVTELYFALRLCEATPVEGSGDWDHSECDHRVRLLDKRDDVYDLPDSLLTVLRDALEELQMAPREAGNSAAPATSSGSSGPRSEEADSPASGPTETSPVPAGT